MNDYIYRLCLDAPLYLKVLEFQSKYKLGKTFASLLIFVEGMKALGLIDKETYEFYRSRYMKPLNDSPIIVLKVPVKCDFCGKEAVGKVQSVKGIVKNVCVYHLEELRNHPKWRVNEISEK